MAKGDLAVGRQEDTAVEALLDRIDIVRDHLSEEIRRDRASEYGDRREESVGRGREAGGAGEYGVTNGRGDTGAATSKNLGDKKGVAAGAAMEPCRIEPASDGEGGDSGQGEGGDRQAVDAGGGGEVAKEMADGVARANLVAAVGGDDEGGGRFDAATEEADKVERRFVGPVDVFDHEQNG